MKTAKAAPSPDTRDRILEAAAELFCREGYSGASISKIAKSAGVLPGSIYWVFESKEHLFAEVLRSESEKWKEKMIQVSAFPLNDISEFSRTFDRVADEFSKSPRFHRLILVVGSARSAATDEALCVVRGVRDFWRQRSEAEILKFTEGLDPDGAQRFARRISRQMTQMLDGVFVSLQIEKDEASIEEMLTDVGQTLSREITYGLNLLKSEQKKT